MSGQGHLVIKGAAWVAATRILVALTGFASTLLLARLLMPADFGLVAIAVAVSSILSGVTELSLAQALIHKAEPDDEDYHTTFTLSLLRGAGLTLILSLAAWPVASIYGDPRLVPVLLAIAAGTLVTGLSNPRMVVFKRKLDFRREFIVVVSQKLVGVVAAGLVAWYTGSYWALVIGSIATEVWGVALSYVLIRYSPRLTLARWRGLLAYSVWLTLSFLVRTLNFRIDTLALGLFAPTRTVGLFTMADNLSGLATRETIAPIATTMFPAFARIADEPDRLREAYRRSSGLLAAIALVAGFGLAASAQAVIPLLIGEKWLEAVPMIRLLGVSVAISSLGWSMIPLGSAVGRTRSVFIYEFSGLACRVVCLAAGVAIGFATAMGPVMGLIAGRSVGLVGGMLINLHLVRSILGVSVLRQLGEIWRVAAGAAAMLPACAIVAAGFVPAYEFAAHAVQAAALVATGGAVFLAVTGSLWLFAGRPAGPESEAVAMLSRLRRR